MFLFSVSQSLIPIVIRIFSVNGFPNWIVCVIFSRHSSLSLVDLRSLLGFAPRVPIVLVGTKVDLRNDPLTLEQLAEKNQRPISQSQGEYLAHVCSAEIYLECSSMLNFNVRNVFQQAIEIHCTAEERSRHAFSHGRRILSRKFHSCSWLGSLFCCTTTSTSSSSKKSQSTNNRSDCYTVSRKWSDVQLGTV